MRSRVWSHHNPYTGLHTITVPRGRPPPRLAKRPLKTSSLESASCRIRSTSCFSEDACQPLSMSTVTLRPSSQQQRASSAHNYRQQLNPASPRSSSNPHPTRQGSNPQPTRQEEKNFIIANYEVAVGHETVPAEQIGRDPQHKQLGFSSQHLRIEDFELMKTLGTGTFEPRPQARPGPVREQNG